MPVFRQFRLVLSLVAVTFAAPALAQQPAATDQSAAPPAATAPAPAAPKPKKHKPAAAPSTTNPSDTATAPAAPPTPPAAATGGAKPTLLGQYGDWGAYSASPGGKKVCFAIAKPSTSETDPPGKSRNPAYIFVSTRPAEKVNNEVSISIGYQFKPSSEATLDIGSNSFALYTQQDGAWIKNASEESQLVGAMRTSQNAVVKGLSAKGTKTTDTFSLRGFAQAIERTGQDCK
jgi:Invasion associated locus B (IalB) protein